MAGEKFNIEVAVNAKFTGQAFQRISRRPVESRLQKCSMGGGKHGAYLGRRNRHVPAAAEVRRKRRKAPQSL